MSSDDGFRRNTEGIANRAGDSIAGDESISLSYDSEFVSTINICCDSDSYPILTGDMYAGKTRAVRRLIDKTPLESTYRHEQLNKETMDEEKVKRIKASPDIRQILEGSRYRLSYIFDSNPISNDIEETEGLFKRLKEKLTDLMDKGHEQELVLPPKYKQIDVRLNYTDAVNLFNHYVLELRKTEKYSGSLQINDERMELFISLASWGGPPAGLNERPKGVLIPQLLKRIIKNNSEMNERELSKQVENERNRERLAASFFGFTALEWGKHSLTFIGVAKQVAETTISLGLISTLGGAALVGASAVLGFYQDGESHGYKRFIKLYKSWNEMPLEKQIMFCDRLDGKYGLTPGSSFAFLQDWLSRKQADENEDETEFEAKIRHLISSELIINIQGLVGETGDLRDRVVGESRRIDEIEESIEKIKDDIKLIHIAIKKIQKEIEEERVRSQENRCAFGSKRVTNEDDLRSKLRVPTEERTKSLVGMMDQDVDLTVKALVKEILDDANGKLVVLIGEPGAGKTTVLFLAARELLSSGAKLYFVKDPTGVDPVKFQELEPAYAIVEFDDPRAATEFFSRPLPEGEFKRIIISVRSGYLSPEEMELITSLDKRFSSKRVHLENYVLKEVAKRSILVHMPGMRENDLERIADVLVERSQRVPLYIVEALKVLKDQENPSVEDVERILTALPVGIKGLVKEILKREERRDSDLLIAYYLVSYSRGMLHEYREAFAKIYGIKEPRFLDVSPDGSISLHSWYHDIFPEVIGEWINSGMISLKNGTRVQRYLENLEEQLSKRDEDTLPNLTEGIFDLAGSDDCMRFLDVADLVMLGATKYLIEKQLVRTDKKNHGFNLFQERVVYSNLTRESVPFYSRMLGFLMNGYMSGEPHIEVMSSDLRPFYCLHVIYVSRLFEEKITKDIDKILIEGHVGKLTPRELRASTVDNSLLLGLYISALTRVLEKLGYFEKLNGEEQAYLHLCKKEYDEANAVCQAALSDTNCAQYHHLRSIALHNLMKYEEALQEENEAIELEPNNQRYVYGQCLGLCYLKRFDEAITAFKNATELNQDNSDFYAGKCWALGECSRFTEALVAIDRAVELDLANGSPQPQRYAARSSVLNNLGQYDQAVEAIKSALDLSPNNPSYHSNLSSYLENLRRYDEAIEEAKIAIALSPWDPALHDIKGLIHIRMKEPEKARMELDAAIKLEPNNPEYHRGKGDALADLGLHKLAEAEYRAALALGLDDADTHCALGVALHNLKEYPEAVEEYDIAIAKEPNTLLHHQNRLLALKKIGDFEEVRKEQERVTSLDPRYPDSHVINGKEMLREQQFGMAEKEFDEAISIHDDPSYHYYRGVALNGLGRFDEAREAFESAMEPRDEVTTIPSNDDGQAIAEYEKLIAEWVKEDTRDPNLLCARGIILLGIGRLKIASEFFDRALILAPHDPSIHYYRGVALNGMDRWEEAIREFDIAMMPME